MRFQRFLSLCLLIVFGMGAFHPPQVAKADGVHPAPAEQVSAYELILAMNTLRVSYGLPALIEDPIVNAVAQSTAATMAANNMSWCKKQNSENCEASRSSLLINPNIYPQTRAALRPQSPDSLKLSTNAYPR